MTRHELLHVETSEPKIRLDKFLQMKFNMSFDPIQKLKNVPSLGSKMKNGEKLFLYQ